MWGESGRRKNFAFSFYELLHIRQYIRALPVRSCTSNAITEVLLFPLYRGELRFREVKSLAQVIDLGSVWGGRGTQFVQTPRLEPLLGNLLKSYLKVLASFLLDSPRQRL